MKLELPDQVIQYIVQVLGDRPYRESAPVIDLIAQQIKAAQTPLPEPVPEPES